MKHYAEQFPNLEYFLDCYFHEDQFDVFDWGGRKHNYKEIVRYFKTKETVEKVSETKKELKIFLSMSKNWDEDKLDDVLRANFSGVFFAPFFKITYREFLEGTLKILEEPMEKTKSEFIPRFIG